MTDFFQWSPTDTEAECELLVEFVRKLRPHLADDYEWLEEGTIELVGGSPVDAGEFANVLVGMRGDQMVAIKHYRIYSSADYMPTYVVSVLSHSRRHSYSSFDRGSRKRCSPAVSSGTITLFPLSGCIPQRSTQCVSSLHSWKTSISSNTYTKTSAPNDANLYASRLVFAIRCNNARG